MFKIATRMMMTAAAASMALAPIAAQAGTRAGDSDAVYSVSTPGLGRAAEGEQAASGFSILLAIFAVGAVAAGIFFAADSEDEGQSPGT